VKILKRNYLPLPPGYTGLGELWRRELGELAKVTEHMQVAVISYERAQGADHENDTEWVDKQLQHAREHARLAGDAIRRARTVHPDLLRECKEHQEFKQRIAKTEIDRLVNQLSNAASQESRRLKTDVEKAGILPTHSASYRPYVHGYKAPARGASALDLLSAARVNRFFDRLEEALNDIAQI
jgi:hypothetical protein